jgi:hypothetical protein
MKKAALWSIAGACLLLTVAGLLTTNPRREMSVTTFGTIPGGYGAVFDLLTGLKFPVERSYAPPERLPRGVTVWWIEPDFMLPRGQPEPSSGGEPGRGAWSGRRWVEDGGTAVIFLPIAGTDVASEIAGLGVPTRANGHPDRPEAAKKGEDIRKQVLEGLITVRSRQLRGPGFATFEEAGDWRVRARLDGNPFVLEQELGKGRVVLVADATVLSNAWLDKGDAAPFAVDLVRSYGVPRFDEREHGLRAEGSALRYLLTSPAVLPFLGLTLVGLLFAWRGAAAPPRAVPEHDPNPPTLDDYVGSLAELYARTGNYGEVYERYRELTFARLRRHFRLPPDTPSTVVEQRLRHGGRVSAAAVRTLDERSAVSDEASLRAAVRALDTFVGDSTR